ncbi:MAG: phenylacetate-CoA oxygenase subunit PaaC [Phycisphaerales bacterium]|nr:phenylacetate-CoA oxygenase subunit PaaC [Phycisphaerales bacterium]
MIPNNLQQPMIDLLLSIADDKFILGHRIADWTGLAPMLEEDIAFSSIAQDELAHAQVLYDTIGAWTGRGGDHVAYGRSPSEYRCAALVEVPDELQWDVAIARQFYCDHFDLLRLGRLARSKDAQLAALAHRLAAEERVHVEHMDHWITQLGKAGGEARERTQRSLDRLAPAASMLFEPTEGMSLLEAAGLYPLAERDFFSAWREDLTRVAGDAGLNLRLSLPDSHAVGGRRGRHDAAFAALLEEITEVYRVEPMAQW